ncbi:hypothetical protein NUSPORA_00389 [Nucleospora cyclopteri]
MCKSIIDKKDYYEQKVEKFLLFCSRNIGIYILLGENRLIEKYLQFLKFDDQFERIFIENHELHIKLFISIISSTPFEHKINSCIYKINYKKPEFNNNDNIQMYNIIESESKIHISKITVLKTGNSVENLYSYKKFFLIFNKTVKKNDFKKVNEIDCKKYPRLIDKYLTTNNKIDQPSITIDKYLDINKREPIELINNKIHQPSFITFSNNMKCCLVIQGNINYIDEIIKEINKKYELEDNNEEEVDKMIENQNIIQIKTLINKKH